MLVHSVGKRLDILEHEPAKQTAMTRISYYVKDNSVSLVRSVYLTGLNKHSGKRWFRWNTDSVRCIRQTRRGIAGLKRDDRHYLTIIPFYEYNNDPTFRELVENKFGEIHWYEIYPMAMRYPGANSEMHVPQGILPAMRATTMTDFTVALFGTKRYSPELEDAVANTDLSTLRLAVDFRGLVHEDELIEFIKNSSLPHGSTIRSVRSQLLLLDSQNLGRLISEPITTANWHYVRTLMSPLYKPRPVSRPVASWRELNAAL